MERLMGLELTTFSMGRWTFLAPARQHVIRHLMLARPAPLTQHPFVSLILGELIGGLSVGMHEVATLKFTNHFATQRRA